LFSFIFIVVALCDLFRCPPWRPNVSEPRSNGDFDLYYKHVEYLAEGANSIVTKVVKRNDPEGKQFAAKQARHGFNWTQDKEIQIMRHL